MKRLLKTNKILMTIVVSLLLTAWITPTLALTSADDLPHIYLASNGGGEGGNGGSGNSEGQGGPGTTGGFGHGTMERTQEMNQDKDQDQDRDKDRDRVHQ